MAQRACDCCNSPLTPDASYCDNCGNRTRAAVRRVRIAIRLELVFIGLIVLMVAAFAFANYHG